MTLTAEQQAEVTQYRSESHTTHRPTVVALEEILFLPQPVLDHGFVRVIDYMGDDGAIVQAARVSYGRGTRKVSEDTGLIRYLMRHRHTSPFEMCEIKLHIKAPIFVARQWLRHRTANVNEISARYSILDQEFYLPEPACLARQSVVNRQGRGDVLSAEEAAVVLEILRDDSMRCYRHYEKMLASPEEGGHDLARELARMNLTLNTYTQWYWKIDLNNLFHFLSLRADSHAQYEIRAYACAILDIARAWVPKATGAFEDYRVGAFHMSRTMLESVRRMLKGEDVTQKNSGLSPREWREFADILGIGGE